MANKLKTSYQAEIIINKVHDLLDLKGSYYLIARLAFGISIVLEQKVANSNYNFDTKGKEFNDYTLFRNEDQNFLTIAHVLLNDLYEENFNEEEILGNNGLIKKHIDLGCQSLGEIYNETFPDKYKFLKKLYSLRFDQILRENLSAFEIPTEKDENITNNFVNETEEKIKNFLRNLGYEVMLIDHSVSSSILRVKVKFPPLNKSIQDIKRKVEDLKLYLELDSDPLISVFGGYLCIDVPRKDREFVYLKDIINRIQYSSSVTFPLGTDVEGNIISIDLSDSSTPHILLGGATGQGKSEMLKTIIATLVTKNTPEDIKLYLIDPKKVEFTKFKRLPHIVEVVCEIERTTALLEEMTTEMDRRYEILSQYQTNSIDKYNRLTSNKWPHIVIIFDEFADFMMSEKNIKLALEERIKKLAGKARAAGIHLILATQRPDKDIITGIIKANLPAKIAFKTTNGVNSEIIIDSPDAKDLLGKGDLIFVKDGLNTRIQGAYIPEDELNELLS